MTTHNKLSRLLSVLLVATALSVSAYGQRTALTSTTLTQAVPAPPATNQQAVTTVSVASATNIVAPQLPSNAGGIGSASSSTTTFLYVDREMMQVNSVNGLYISVGRGVQGTVATGHANSATVYVLGGRQFVPSLSYVQGTCNSVTQPRAIPYIEPLSGTIWTCPAVGPYTNLWTKTGEIQAANYTPSDNTLPGTSVSFVCHARYNFAVDGGAVGLITPAVGCTIPINAVITKVIVDCIATTVGSTGNISVGLSAGGAGAAALLGATARGSCTAGTLFDGVPVAGASASASNATYIKMSAAGNVTFTIATNALTAGVVDVDVWYYVLQA